MLLIYDKDYFIKGYSWNYADLCITHTVSDGKKQLKFKWLYSDTVESKTFAAYNTLYDRTLSYIEFTATSGNFQIETEDHIFTDDDEYVVKSVSGNRTDGFEVVCDLNLQDLTEYIYPSWSCTDATIGDAVSDLLTDYNARVVERYGPGSDTEKMLKNKYWSVGESTVTKRRSLTLTNVTPLQIIEKLAIAYMIEPVWDTLNGEISFYEKIGQDRGVYMRSGLNLKSISKSTDSYDLYTKIYPIGKDGITPGYLTNYSYSDIPRVYVWEDDNYTDLQTLTADATALLADLCHPIVSYSCQVVDLAKQAEIYDGLAYAAGDTILLVDDNSGTYDRQRIVKTTTYPLNPDKNSVELANCMLTFEQMQAKLKQASDIIGTVVSSDGKISYRKVKGMDEDPDEQNIQNVENVLRLSSAGMSKTQRVNQINTVLDMSDTSGTETQQINRAVSALSLNATASTGSDVLDDFDERITENTEGIADINARFEISSGDPQPVLKTLKPTKSVKKYLYAVRNKTEYGPNNSYSYEVYEATPGMTYYLTGHTPSNVNQHPLVAFYDENDTFLSADGETTNTDYTDYEVVAPAGAASMIINDSSASLKIKAVGAYVLTGSTVVDTLTLDLADAKADVNTLKTTIEAMQETVSIGVTMEPTSTASGLYNVNNGAIYSGSTYSHSFYDVTDLEYVFLTGSSATNVGSYPMAAAYDSNGRLLDSFGIDPVTIYRDYKVKLPNGAVSIVVQTSMASVTVIAKEGVVDESGSGGGGADITLLKNLADVRISDAKKNPFEWAELDKGYVTFVVDDLCTDLDSIASIFEEYGYPFGIAAIPDRLDIAATYLQQTRGNFTPGMTMREIMAQVVANGGEIMTHNSSPVVTVDNQDDDEFMKGYFCTSKKNLENAGFTVRGLIRAGGTGAISATPQIERWLTIGGYEYSNIGTADNYNQDRTTIQKTNQEIKDLITQAYNNHTWRRWMVHSYTFGEGQTFTGEADLREILSHCQTLGIPVVTYGYMFDHFRSSHLEETIKAL